MSLHTAPKPPPGDWARYANCLGLDPDLFFTARGASSDDALAVCRECVVRADCLAYALSPPFEFIGVWGGTSVRERRRMRQTRRSAT